MTIALYPGSFDPITNGHLDVIESASKIFNKVIIAVLHNVNKTPMLSVQNRIKLIKESTIHLKNVKVVSFEGLTVECAKRHKAAVILRGLRAVSDFEYEMQLSQMNHLLNSEAQTVFLPTKPEHSFISSSIIKEIFKNNGDISNFVPKSVINFLNK